LMYSSSWILVGWKFYCADLWQEVYIMIFLKIAPNLYSLKILQKYMFFSFKKLYYFK
jgi:hypothetical protein